MSSQDFIYKYQSASELKLSSLRRGEVFFADITELNDGHEGKPALVLSGRLEVYERFFEWLSSRLIIPKVAANKSTVQMLYDISLRLASHVKRESKGRDIHIDEIADLLNLALIKISNDVDVSNGVRRLLLQAPDFLRHEVQDYVGKSFSTASFSRTSLNPTMWGHYGDADKGFVTCYQVNGNSMPAEFSEHCFTECRNKKIILEGIEREVTELGLSTKGSIELQQVSYSNRRPKVNLAHLFSNQFLFSEAEQHYDYDAHFCGSVAQKQFEKFLLFKSPDWRYEKEVRLVHSGAKLPEHRLGVLGGLDSIILGFNTNNVTSERIIESMKQFVKSGDSLAPKSVTIFRAVPNSTSYKYNLKLEGEILMLEGRCVFARLKELDGTSIKKLKSKMEIIKNSK